MRLYTAATPNGRKVSIALEELGVPYDVERVDINADDHPTPEFLALTPNHKIPVLEDEGVVVWESGAILIHLAEKFGKLLPQDLAGRLSAIQWAFFQSASLGPTLGRLAAQLRRPAEERNTEMVQIFAGEMERIVGVLDRELEDGRPYLAGDYSIADIMHYPWLHPVLGLKASALMAKPRVVAWLERIGERPAVARGMEIPG